MTTLILLRRGLIDHCRSSPDGADDGQPEVWNFEPRSSTACFMENKDAATEGGQSPVAWLRASLG